MRSQLLVVIASSLMIYIGCALGDDRSSATTLPSLSAVALATMPTSAPVAITWDQAKDFVGHEATVTGPVVGTHDFGGAAVLNIGKDYPDKGRFTVFLTADKRRGMPADLDAGKTISATGKIKLFHHVLEIEGDPAHIVVVNGAATAPTSQP